MPLASPIGSGRGILTRANIEIIIEEATVPVVVDAGLGVPSEAAAVMEMGADAVLVNTALAEARDPVRMAAAFAQAVGAGREARLAGRMPVRAHASPSSPVAGVVRLPDPEVPVEARVGLGRG
jgi:thiazole synthase